VVAPRHGRVVGQFELRVDEVSRQLAVALQRLGDVFARLLLGVEELAPHHEEREVLLATIALDRLRMST
jgi:hypothetical protein